MLWVYVGEDSIDSMIQNNYLEAKSKYRDDGDLEGALEQFRAAIELDETLDDCEKTKWGFKSRQQIASIYFQLAQRERERSDGDGISEKQQQYLDLSFTNYEKAMKQLRKSKHYSPKDRNLLPILEQLDRHPRRAEIHEMTLRTVRFSSFCTSLPHFLMFFLFFVFLFLPILYQSVG